MNGVSGLSTMASRSGSRLSVEAQRSEAFEHAASPAPLQPPRLLQGIGSFMVSAKDKVTITVQVSPLPHLPLGLGPGLGLGAGVLPPPRLVQVVGGGRGGGGG